MSSNVIQFPRSTKALLNEWVRIKSLPDGPAKDELLREWAKVGVPRAISAVRKALQNPPMGPQRG